MLIEQAVLDWDMCGLSMKKLWYKQRVEDKNKKGVKDQEAIKYHTWTRIPHGKVTKTQLNLTNIRIICLRCTSVEKNKKKKLLSFHSFNISCDSRTELSK